MPKPTSKTSRTRRKPAKKSAAERTLPMFPEGADGFVPSRRAVIEPFLLSGMVSTHTETDPRRAHMEHVVATHASALMAVCGCDVCKHCYARLDG